MMTGSSESTAKSLELMLEYLKGTLADQLATLRDVDTKVNIRLTIYVGILGLVTLGLPAVGGTRAPRTLVYVAILLVIVFWVCLLRCLWLALSVLNARVDLPGIAAGSFQSAAQREQLDSAKVLRELVQNYARAVESNWALMDERLTPGTALRAWSRGVLVVG